MSTATLERPFYVHLFDELDEDTRYKVVFYDPNDNIEVDYIKTASQSNLLNNDKTYSIAFYGCFQPFTVKKKYWWGDLISSVYEVDPETNFSKRFLILC